MPADRRWHGLARVQFDPESRPTRSEFSALNDPAGPWPGLAELNAQFAIAGDLPRALRDEPVQRVRPAVGDERIARAVVGQPRVAQPANPRGQDKAAKVEHVLAVRDEKLMTANLKR